MIMMTRKTRKAKMKKMMMVVALCVSAKQVSDASCITLMNREAPHTYIVYFTMLKEHSSNT